MDVVDEFADEWRLELLAPCASATDACGSLRVGRRIVHRVIINNSNILTEEV